jgi:hypothetical protein
MFRSGRHPCVRNVHRSCSRREAASRSYPDLLPHFLADRILSLSQLAARYPLFMAIRHDSAPKKRATEHGASCLDRRPLLIEVLLEYAFDALP